MAKRHRLTPWRKLLNALVKALIRIALAPKTTYLLSICGRKTGALYTTPVTLVEKGNERWLVAPYGDVGWSSERQSRRARDPLSRRTLRVHPC